VVGATFGATTSGVENLEAYTDGRVSGGRALGNVAKASATGAAFGAVLGGGGNLLGRGTSALRNRPSGGKAGPQASGTSAAAPRGQVAAPRGRGVRPLPGTRTRPGGVPQNWRIRSTDTAGGTRYIDPKNPGNAVRVMQGNPKSPYPNSRAPYVRWQRNGQALDRFGNVVPKNSPSAHIPLKDFNFNPGLFN
jgi:hypothetical protein